MKAPALILTATISVCAGTALAACPGKSASNGPDTQTAAGISKDGTHAPLEQPISPTQDRKNSAQKDGTTVPLVTKEGGGNAKTEMAWRGRDASATSPMTEKHKNETAEKKRCAWRKPPTFPQSRLTT